MSKEQKIPKIIHYCWFGHGEYDEKIKNCMKTWEEVLPEYKVMRWDEDSFDLDSCTYVKQAYEKKRWAFVTDYVRFKMLREYGGIYMDTDMEILKPLDEFLDNEVFLSFKQLPKMATNTNHGLSSAVIGAVKGNHYFDPIIEQLESRSYLTEDGQEDVTPIAKYLTDMLYEHGLAADNTLQKIDGIAIYPNEYLCPTLLSMATGEFVITENTYAVHHYAGSWRTPEIMSMLIEKIKNAKDGENVI